MAAAGLMMALGRACRRYLFSSCPKFETLVINLGKSNKALSSRISTLRVTQTTISLFVFATTRYE